MAFFQQQKPAFVSVHKEQFVIGHIPHDSLRVFIIKVQPIRKFFRDGKLECYSMDAKISRSKKYCVFCNDAWQCQAKLRLSMLQLDAMHPIILDINQPSFERFQALLDQYKNSLDSIPVTIKIIYDEQDRRGIEFAPHS